MRQVLLRQYILLNVASHYKPWGRFTEGGKEVEGGKFSHPKSFSKLRGRPGFKFRQLPPVTHSTLWTKNVAWHPISTRIKLEPTAVDCQCFLRGGWRSTQHETFCFRYTASRQLRWKPKEALFQWPRHPLSSLTLKSTKIINLSWVCVCVCGCVTGINLLPRLMYDQL